MYRGFRNAALATLLLIVAIANTGCTTTQSSLTRGDDLTGVSIEIHKAPG